MFAIFADQFIFSCLIRIILSFSLMIYVRVFRLSMYNIRQSYYNMSGTKFNKGGKLAN